MKKHNFIYLVIILLIFLSIQKISSQNPIFDSLANEINEMSIYKKTQSLELLDILYQMAYNNPDSSLLIARCIYEESSLNLGIRINKTQS